MTGPIDRAEVEIVPDVSHFDRDVKRELDKTFAGVERKLDDVVESIEDGFERMIKILDIHFENLQHSVDRVFDNIQQDARGAGRSIAVDIEEGTAVAKHAIDDLADNAHHDFNRIERDARGARTSIAGMFSSLFSSIGQGATAAVGGLSEVGGVLGKLGNVGDVVIAVLKITAISALIPVIFGLSGALLQLLGILALIPAAIGFVIVAIAPLIIAFKGVGDAIGAGLSGDVEKFNEALKGLAEPAQKVVKEIVGLKKVFSDIKKDVQTAFFAPLIGQIKALGTTLFPVLRGGLETVADSLGRFIAQFLELLRANDILDAINDLFKSTGRIINQLAPTVVRFFGVFFGMLEHGLPFLERMFAALGTGIEKFTDFLSRALTTGDFEKWLEDAFDVLKDLWGLLKSVGNLIGALFGDMGESGQDFIKTLTEMINKLAAFFRSEDGKEFLENMKDALKTVGTGLLFLGVTIANVARWLNSFVEFVKGIGPFFTNLWNGVVSATASAWDWVVNKVSSAWNAVVGFFTAIPGRVGNFLSTLPDMLRDIATRAFDAFFFAIGFGTAKIILFIQGIPGVVAQIFTDMWETSKNIVMNGVDAVVAFVSALPSRIAVFIALTWARAKGLFIDGINAVVSFMQQLGPRAASAASSLPGQIFNAIKGFLSTAFEFGRNIVEGMINGIKSVAGHLVDVAKRVVSDAIAGARHALGAHSPSKEWAKLGVQSVQGYAIGFSDEADAIAKHLANSIQLPMDAFNRSNTQSVTNNTFNQGGGTPSMVAYVQIGDGQLERATVRVIEDHPQEVALAAESGGISLQRRR